MEQNIVVERSERVCTLRIDRPAKKNALTSEMYGRMADAICDANDDAECRAILITGVPGTFCAGNDLNAFMNPEGTGEQVLRFLHELSHAPKPLVIGVTGIAIGIGATMLLHADYAVAADDAQFKMPFTELALVPEAASTLLIPSRLGRRVAGELLLLSEPFDARRAVEWGFVNRLVAADRVIEEAMGVARRFAALPPDAVQATKKLIREPEIDRIEAAMRRELDCFGERLRSPELFEAVGRMLGKNDAPS